MLLVDSNLPEFFIVVLKIKPLCLVQDADALVFDRGLLYYKVLNLLIGVAILPEVLRDLGGLARGAMDLVEVRSVVLMSVLN